LLFTGRAGFLIPPREGKHFTNVVLLGDTDGDAQLRKNDQRYDDQYAVEVGHTE
jgi:hypothetical protein